MGEYIVFKTNTSCAKPPNPSRSLQTCFTRLVMQYILCGGIACIVSVCACTHAFQCFKLCASPVKHGSNFYNNIDAALVADALNARRAQIIFIFSTTSRENYCHYSISTKAHSADFSQRLGQWRENTKPIHLAQKIKSNKQL